MAETDRIKYLRFALLLVGLIFVVGIYPLTIIWPSGWSWHTGQSDYLQMILGIYATLGVFLLVASRNPLAHLSLIWFTVWSSIVHLSLIHILPGARAEWGQGFVGAEALDAGHAPRFRDAVDRGEGDLVLLSVFAGGLAERGGGFLHVQDVVHDLKGQADMLAVAGERLVMRVAGARADLSLIHI